MNHYLILLVLLTGMAFVAGIAVALVVCEHSLATRDRRQAHRERELAEFSAFLNSVDPRSRGGP